MKLLLKISFLLISITLYAQNGGIYEINSGRKGVKLFDSGNFRGKWSEIISLNLNNDGLSDLMLINHNKTKLKMLSVKDKITKVNSDIEMNFLWNFVNAVDLNGDKISEIVFMDSSCVNGRVCSYSTSENKYICDTLKSLSAIENPSHVIALRTDKSDSEKLLMYSSKSGIAAVYMVDQGNNLVKITDEFNLQKGFDQLIATNTNGDKISELMLLNKKKQFYKLVTFKENNVNTILDSVKVSIKWDNVINGNFGSGRSQGDFIFNSKSSGKQHIFKLDFNGLLVPFKYPTCNLGAKWDMIVPGKFSYNYTDGILLYKN